MKKTLKLLLTVFLLVGLISTIACTEKEGPKQDEETEVVVSGNEYAKYPFPQHPTYAVEPMKPSDKSQEELESMVLGLFKEIMTNDLIVDSNGPQNKDEFRMVFRHYQEWEIEEKEIKVSHLNVSESQGYGMMMIAYMAGCEEQLGLTKEQWLFDCTRLQDYYDAMLRTVIHFSSIVGNKLFSWELTGYPKQGKNQTGYKTVDGMKTAPFTQNPKDGDSATDGDMDIIYSLILADWQWGSEGKYNYKQIATDMLKDLWDYCVHDEYYTLLLGDWAKTIDDPVLKDATRTSDFIISHLKVYKEFDENHDWQKVIDATYNVIKDIRDTKNGQAQNNGLLPDFVVRGETKWEVPKGEILEGDEDNAFAYNACRVPWRLGTDYLLFGNTEIGNSNLLIYIIRPLDIFARNFTAGELDKFGPVYLDGSEFEWDDAETFAAPFLVTAAGNGIDQDWVNDLWAYEELSTYHGNNYADYYSVFVMLTAAGNYWVPIK